MFDFPFIFKGFVSSTEDCTLLSEIFRIYINKDLTSYLISTSDYIAQASPVGGVSAGSVSKLSVSGDVATLSATAHVWNTKEFIEGTQYILEFNIVTAGYPGYDFGVYVGENSANCIGFNFQANQWKPYPGTNVNFQKRYTSYVPVKIIRNGNNWNIDINNGELSQNLISNSTIKNMISMVKFSGGTMSIKNLQITY